jgi:hypothetical protein
LLSFQPCRASAAAGFKTNKNMRSQNTVIKPAKIKAVSVEKQNDGSMRVLFSDGTTGILTADDKEIQAFLVYTMLNPECTR